MKTVLMLLSALAVCASASAPGLAQADSVQSPPTTPTLPPPDRGNDTNAPQLPGGSGGDGDPSPDGGGGDGPTDGDFEPVEVEFGGDARICCRAFYSGADWSTRTACLNGGGDVAPDALCTPDDPADAGPAVPLRTFEGYDIVPLDTGHADTRPGETVDGAPVRRRVRDRRPRDDF